MLGITDPITYLIGVITIILLPGANTMFSLTVAGRYGIAEGYKAAAGILLGNSVLMAISALGGASLLMAIPHLFELLQMLGCGYLTYIGVKMLYAGLGRWHNNGGRVKAVPTPVKSVRHIFRQAFLLSLLNPQTIFFFLSFFVQFVDRHYSQPILSFFLLAGIYQLVSLIYLSILILSGASLVARFGRSKPLAGAAMSLIGFAFIGFAVKLWTASIK
ncbi:leucine efflux protein [Mesocricetibacter intestinalis]|uniref:Leucine efflux protein n=1 Tax=Mesocricetibacter intestinalis TaxID=1521930 RepID=A0A4R6V9P8_9PAST|nr:leucine efflux protein LeuE [Mesocricetibacter intestinalis]TDQ56489.1 leucine efflux protein [Mesocricetibacter intestinalis]